MKIINKISGIVVVVQLRLGFRDTVLIPEDLVDVLVQTQGELR